MLSCDEQADLAMAICATAETLGQVISPNAAKMMAEDLADHSVDVIANALRGCRRELTGRLTLGAILQRVQAADGRPGKDEAWSMALAASDEFETVVLTDEIRQAMVAAGPILDAGDKVGARMAFMSAYERLVGNARAESLPAKWEVSLGFDPGRRVIAIESAVRSQLISHDAGNRYLADLRIAPITPEGKAIAGLLTGQAPARVSPKMREKLAEVRSILTASKARKEQERRKEAQRRRVDNYLRKRRARAAIAELQSKKEVRP